jgi:hypothetical protein
MSVKQLVQILRSGVGARRRGVITQLFSLTAAQMRGVVATCRVDGRCPSRRPWEAPEYELLRDALYNHYTKVNVELVPAVTITDLNSKVQTIFFLILSDASTLLLRLASRFLNHNLSDSPIRLLMTAAKTLSTKLL